MKFNKIYTSIFLGIITIGVAFCTLLYPILNKEIIQDDFLIYHKKFENNSELKNRDINKSILRAKKTLKDNIYYGREPFSAISFKDAWISSSPNLTEYIQNKNSVYSNTSHEFLVQTLDILYDLILAHKQSNDNRFLWKGYEVIHEWYMHNSRFNIFQSLLVWNDHVVSERIMAILLFNDYARQYTSLDSKNKNIINKISKDSILYLASPYNYKHKHNHGIYEDFALLVSAGYLKNKKQKESYFKIAINRFMKQVTETYDANGVHLENSPKYHLMITDLLNDFVQKAKSLNLKIDAETLNKVKLANKNKYFFILNNGNIPPVGDSIYTFYDNFNQQNDEVLISNDAGYVVFKNKTNYLLIRAESISSVHGHQDQLSFIYEDKKDLIVSEPGFLDYSSSKENRFVHSKEAHNTVYIKDSKKIKHYYFNNILNNEQFFYCKVLSLDKNISRTFLLDKKLKILLVQDIVNNYDEKDIFEVLNFSTDVVQIKDEKNCQEIEMTNRHKYYVGSFQYEDYIGGNTLYGSKKPYFGGWSTIPYKNLIPSYTLLTPLEKNKNIRFIRIISEDPIESFSHKSNNIVIMIDKDKIAYDLSSIEQQSKTNLNINVHEIEQKSYMFDSKIKKKISPSFYKRIKIFIYESLIMIFILLLYIILKKAYFRWFVWSSLVIINLFNIWVFAVT